MKGARRARWGCNVYRAYHEATHNPANNLPEDCATLVNPADACETFQADGTWPGVAIAKRLTILVLAAAQSEVSATASGQR